MRQTKLDFMRLHWWIPLCTTVRWKVLLISGHAKTNVAPKNSTIRIDGLFRISVDNTVHLQTARARVRHRVLNENIPKSYGRPTEIGVGARAHKRSVSHVKLSTCLKGTYL